MEFTDSRIKMFVFVRGRARARVHVSSASPSNCRPNVGSLNPLAPNGVYIRRTAQLTSRRCILNIYSTNILTEYFKHAAHSPFFFKMSFVS